MIKIDKKGNNKTTEGCQQYLNDFFQDVMAIIIFHKHSQSIKFQNMDSY